MEKVLPVPQAISRTGHGPIQDAYAELGIRRLPYPIHLSFEPLIRRIEQTHEMGCVETLLTEQLLKRLERADHFRGPITDIDKLNDNRDLLDLLLGMIIAPYTRETQLAKISPPFEINAFYVTPAMRRLAEENDLFYEVNNATEIMYTFMVVGACSLILNTFYGQNLRIDPPISLSVRNRKTGLTRHFKTQIDSQFIEIHQEKPLRPITQEEINGLLGNVYDIDRWLEYFPPENFSFHGLAVGHLIDITEEEAVSRLKYRLLSKEAILNGDSVRELEELLRTFFRIPELRMGITAIDFPRENAVDHKYKIRFDFLAEKEPVLLSEANRNSIYEKACRYKEVLLLEDLEAVEPRTPIEEKLLKVGLRSIMVAPLLNKREEVIGLLEIASVKPFELHSFVELKFKEIISLFSLAIERSREEIDNQVEAVVREQFTAVHPVVEWRFIEASYNLLERRARGETAMMEPIVFQDVFALYGQADIVSSSELRNEAIRADLLENLRLALRLLTKCLQRLPFPLMDQMVFRIEQTIALIERDFTSSDETGIVDLLHQKVHPLLDNLAESQPALAADIATYFDKLDPELGIIFRQRKDYEASVTRINSTIANYLDQQERITQKTTPHYFEKYKTDGVEYDIYVGQSLLKEGAFCHSHFRNLRLWQLLHMVEITRAVHALKGELPVSLTTAQLIFAYHSPLSIRFRQDEKKFDVDGAYNVRYQILKKRIDKALIEGTNDRLTRSGHIAIVYLQEKDKEEYLEYMDFLRSKDLLVGEVEDLPLARMQGVQGLRALRIQVNL